MKRFFASAVFGLLSFPAISFACGGGGDCGGMELPPPTVPAPPHPQLDALLGSFSSHIGLFIGLALALGIGAVLARRPRILAPEDFFASGEPKRLTNDSLPRVTVYFRAAVKKSPNVSGYSG